MRAPLLGEKALRLLCLDVCPDCHRPGLVMGPRGGMCTNEACPHCGTEFNVGRLDDQVVIAHHNTQPGQPNRERLRTTFGIERLTEDEPEGRSGAEPSP